MMNICMYYENTYIVIPVQKYVSHYVLNKSCFGILFLFMFFFSSFISYNISTGEEIQSYIISTGEEIQ